METGEQYRSGSAVKDPNRATELEASATAIREVSLGPPAPAPAVPVQPIRDLAVQRMLLETHGRRAGNRPHRQGGPPACTASIPHRWQAGRTSRPVRDAGIPDGWFRGEKG